MLKCVQLIKVPQGSSQISSANGKSTNLQTCKIQQVGAICGQTVCGLKTSAKTYDALIQNNEKLWVFFMKGPKRGRTFQKRCLFSLFYGEKFVDLRVPDWHI
jgi:hypothetical protein